MKKVILFILTLFISFTLISCDEKKDIAFSDLTVVYDGKPHKIEVLNLGSRSFRYLYTKDVDPSEGIVEFKDVGSYQYRVEVVEGGKSIGEYEATLTIIPKYVIIYASDIIEDHDGNTSELNYTIEGLLPGDELGEYVEFTDKMECQWENKNYRVVIYGGRYKKWTTIFNNYDDFYASNINALSPELAPVVFKDNIFANKTITSITFVYCGTLEDYTGKLILPLYIVNSDLSTKRGDCTLANGKKIEIDLTEVLPYCYYGELITIDNLEIYIGEDETLAIGDTNMNFYIGYQAGSESYQIIRNVFDKPVKSYNTLPLIVEGYLYL